MKKLGLPDSADVNLPPPHPQFILLQSIIASSLERKKDRQKMPAKPFSPALLSCKALPLFWRTALTLQVLAQGTRWSATWACSRVSRAVVNRECDSGSIRACIGPQFGRSVLDSFWSSTVTAEVWTQSGMAPRHLALQDFGQPSWALCLNGPHCNKRGMAGGSGSGGDLDRQALLWTPAVDTCSKGLLGLSTALPTPSHFPPCSPSPQGFCKG